MRWPMNRAGSRHSARNCTEVSEQVGADASPARTRGVRAYAVRLPVTGSPKPAAERRLLFLAGEITLVAADLESGFACLKLDRVKTAVGFEIGGRIPERVLAAQGLFDLLKSFLEIGLFLGAQNVSARGPGEQLEDCFSLGV